jgi:pimeloyl-ACP methyl ester carboxylesterase
MMYRDMGMTYWLDRATTEPMELIDRAGHVPHLEHPERVAGLVGDFLSL